MTPYHMELIVIAIVVIVACYIGFRIGKAEGIELTRTESIDCVIHSGRRDKVELSANERFYMIAARKQVLDEFYNYWCRKDNGELK